MRDASAPRRGPGARVTAAGVALLVGAAAAGTGAVVAGRAESHDPPAASGTAGTQGSPDGAVDPGAPGAAGSGAAPSAPNAPEEPPPEPVLAPVVALPTSPVPSARGVAASLDPLLRAPPLRKGVGAVVVDPVTGTLLYSKGADQARTPASVTKLLTAAAALEILGPQERVQTRVVAGGEPGEIVLVGGGDPLLTALRAKRDGLGPQRASLSDLAKASAAVLRAQGRRRVTVRVDDSLFSGSRVSADWKPGYVRDGEVAPVSALAVDSARSEPGEDKRATDPAVTAGRRFAVLLRAEGLQVSATVVHRRATPQASQLAAVSSPPVSSLVEQALQHSDNDVAETLARLVAVREGRAATFAGATAAVAAALDRLGVATPRLRMLDGSGLSRGSRIAPVTLAGLLVLATQDRFPQLRFLLSGLPVAGFSGTLANRYADPSTAVAAGILRAKTGSLSGVNSLAGTVRDADGRLLVFVVMADEVPADGGRGARLALDRVGAALARCGCS